MVSSWLPVASLRPSKMLLTSPEPSNRPSASKSNLPRRVHLRPWGPGLPSWQRSWGPSWLSGATSPDSHWSTSPEQCALKVRHEMPVKSCYINPVTSELPSWKLVDNSSSEATAEWIPKSGWEIYCNKPSGAKHRPRPQATDYPTSNEPQFWVQRLSGTFKAKHLRGLDRALPDLACNAARAPEATAACNVPYNRRQVCSPAK